MMPRTILSGDPVCGILIMSQRALIRNFYSDDDFDQGGIPWKFKLPGLNPQIKSAA